MASEHMRRCYRCHTMYDWRSSSSRFLKMTYCSYWCELKVNGFLIEDIDRVFQEHPHGDIGIASLDELIAVESR
ncbi:MAG TPA: hypothetical protein VIU40_08395 [Geobacteraceae bacterium]